MCMVITGKDLSALNEIYRQESETQIIIDHKYYDSVDKSLLEKQTIFEIRYRGQIFYPLRDDDTLLREKARLEGFDEKKDQLFCCCSNWNIINDENPLIKDFNSFCALLNSQKYHNYVKLTDSQKSLLDELRKCKLRANKFYSSVRSLQFLIDFNDPKITSLIIPDEKEFYLFCYTVLESLYDNIRKLEYQGSIITATEMINKFSSQEYPIRLYKGNCTSIEWFQRKIKLYPNDSIEIKDSENKVYTYQPSSFTLKRSYLIRGKGGKYDEEECHRCGCVNDDLISLECVDENQMKTDWWKERRRSSQNTKICLECKDNI